MKKTIIAVSCIVLITACKSKNQEVVKPHPESMSEIYPKPKVEIKTVGIYLYDGYSALDAMGPYSVFTRLLGSNVFFIAKHKGIVVDGAGLKVQVDTSIYEVKQLDILLIPGGLAQTYQETKNDALLNWVRSIDNTSKYTTSVCTGAWILGASGLLKNKEATTHWYGKKMLANDFGAKVQNTRYTHSGKYWTGAGVSAGIDMSLALLNEIAGEQYTRAVMLDLEYDPQPPFKGGNETYADKNMVEGMRALYDGGMQTALHPEKVFKGMKFDNKKDFVCGMPITAGIADTVNYNGKVYGFCSTGCKDEFKTNQRLYSAMK
jgi:putative intracellular protease/amidase/YHS domain-containing protein